MTGDKKINKNGLNNIFTTGKNISRNEASKIYQQLTPEAREEAVDWINRRFYLATSFPKDVKLDPKNPDHGEYVEEWLQQRDIVMGWDIKWETTIGQNRVPKYFSENNRPTQLAKLEKGEGIFEQRMTGSEFNKYVYNQLYEGFVYSNPVARRFVGRLSYEAKIAENLTKKLTGNELWYKNALGSKEARDALRTLVMLLPINSENTVLRKKLEASLEPYRHEPLIKRAENMSYFNEIYAQLETQIKKGLESEGYTVEKIYVKEFSNDSLEIRASVKKQVTLNNQTYGYRGDPYTNNVRTEKKDINVGGFSYSTGAILNHSYFAKHGTAQTDWDTQLALGEVAVMAGVGIKSVVSGIGRIMINRKAATKTLKELSEEVSERTLKVTDPALRDTVPISLADTIPISKANTVSMTKGDTLPKLNGRSGTQTLKGMGEPSLPRIKQPKPSKRESSDTLAPAIVPDKGAKWYTNTKRITASLEDGATPRQLQAARARAASRKPGARELKEAPSGGHDLHITRRYGERVPPEQIPRYSERLTARLGDTPQIQNRNQEIFRKAGFTEQDVSEWVGRLQKKAESMGLDSRNAEKAVQSHISTESGLIQHLKNKNGLTWRQVRGELQESAPSGGDVRLAIAQLDEGVKLEKSWAKAKNDYPGIEGTPRGVRLLKDLGRKAHQEAYKDLDDMLTLWDRGGLRLLEKRAGVSVLSATEAGAAISLTPELRETKKETESLPKIREKSKQNNEQKKIRENRIKPKTSKL